jgi:hypothetical protein
MTDEAKKLFVKDTVGDTSHLSQAKSIIKNAKKDQNFYDTVDKNKPKKDIDKLFKESKIISKINENIEAIVTATGQGGNESTSRYVGEDKKDIESQVIDGMDIDKEDIHEIDIKGETDEERGYKADVDEKGNDKPKPPVDNGPNPPMLHAPVGGEMMQTGITESRIEFKKSIKEEEELQRQTLANGVQNIRVKYTKGIVDSLKLYSDLLPKAQSEYGMNDLAVQLQHHIEEDQEELEKAIKELKKEDREEVERYQKTINENELPEALKKNMMDDKDDTDKVPEVLEDGSEDEDHSDPSDDDTKGSIEGGIADKMTIEDIAKKHGVPNEVIEEQIKKGIEVEMEHTDSEEKAMEISMDHLVEFPDYYDRLLEMEREAKAEIKEKEGKEEIDLSNELTKKEQKRLDKEPSVEEKNELDPEKDNSEGTSDVMSKYFEGQMV